MEKCSRHGSLCLALLLFSLITSISVRAQSNGKIAGTVVDADTGDPFPGVSVYLEQKNHIGTITQADGKFFLLSVPPGKYTLVMSFVGFATLKQENVEVFSGRTTTVDVIRSSAGCSCSLQKPRRYGHHGQPKVSKYVCVLG